MTKRFAFAKMKHPAINLTCASLFVLFFFLPGISIAAGEIVLHIVLQPDNHLLLGEATISPEPGEHDPLHLALSEKATGIRVQQNGLDMAFGFANGRLTIPTTTDLLTVSWQARFDQPVPTTPTHHEDPSYGVRAIISSVGTFLGRESNWHPRPLNGPSTYELTVESPAGYRVISQGVLLKEQSAGGRGSMTWKSTLPESALTLAGGPLQLTTSQLDDIQLFTFLSAENQPLADTYLAATRNYLEMYIDLFGPYPFGKFAVVENFIPTGYGFPGWTLLGSTVIRLPFIVTTSLGHEVAHSWWGNGVHVDIERGNWSEALTTYIADHLYKERESAEAARDYRLKILRDYAALVDKQNRFPLNRFISRHDRASQAIGYGKGMMVFHMLRREIGEEPFWQGLRSISGDRMGERVSWEDLRGVFEKTSGRSLKAWFDQWLTRADAPELALTNVTMEDTNHGWQVNGAIKQSGPPFQLNLLLKLECGDEETSMGRVRLEGARTPFSLTCRNQPTRLTGDPMADLFRELGPGELPPTVNGLRNPTRLLLVTSPSSDRQNSGPLLGAFRQNRVDSIPAEQWSVRTTRDRDLLVTGAAADICLSSLPNEAEIKEGQLHLPAGDFDLASHSVFLALRHPANPERNCFVFLTPPDAPRAVVSRKIPHYGKYGYLVFDGPTNVAKGFWPPEDSPLTIEFEKR